MQIKITVKQYNNLVAKLTDLNTLDVIRNAEHGVSNGKAYVVLTVKPYYANSVKQLLNN